MVDDKLNNCICIDGKLLRHQEYFKYKYKIVFNIEKNSGNTGILYNSCIFYITKNGIRFENINQYNLKRTFFASFSSESVQIPQPK